MSAHAHDAATSVELGLGQGAVKPQVKLFFKEQNVDLIDSRDRRRGDLTLDESFFPVLWDESG